MAKRAYIGIDGVARKVRKGFIGVDGVARKIKKAYIGIGGVARPCWSGGKAAYYGAITALSQARRNIGAAFNSKYAIFAGGCDYSESTKYTTVDAYSSQLTRTAPASALGAAASHVSGAIVGDYAVFAGGYYSFSSSAVQGGRAQVYAYDATLAKVTPTALSEGRSTAGASIGGYALFAGGYGMPHASSSRFSSAVDVYDQDLTRTVGRSLPVTLEIAQLGNAETSDFGFFFGGFGGVNSSSYPHSTFVSSKVYAFGKDLTQHEATMSVARQLIGVAAFDDVALAFGGQMANALTNIVEKIDNNLTITSLPPLPTPARWMSAVRIGENIVLAGGYADEGAPLNAVYLYDMELTRTNLDSVLSQARSAAASGTVGDYALVAGGLAVTAKAVYNTVDAFMI